MSNKKYIRLLGLIMMLVMVFSLAACGKKDKKKNETASTVTVLTTEATTEATSDDTSVKTTESISTDTQTTEVSTESDTSDVTVSEANPPTETATETTTEATTEATTETTTEAATEDTSDAAEIDEDGSYTKKEDVALYLYVYGKLPQNFITKKEAQNLGWSGGSLEPYAPGKCIGGDKFGNYEGVLPDGKYHECDIDTLGKKSRGAKRIVYSDDGRIYYTEDHYETFELLYGEE